jgi:hypothetical protein
MRKSDFGGWWTLGVVLLCGGLLAGGLCGCETLRRKFVRQKKSTKDSEEVAPVLDPIDYPRVVVTAQGQYHRHFSLSQVWFKELLIHLAEGGSDKKTVFLMNQIKTQVAGMRALLTGEYQAKADVFLKQILDIEEELRLPAAVRNNDGISRRLNRISWDIRLTLEEEQVKDHLADSPADPLSGISPL